MPIDFQTIDYNTVLDSLSAGDYSITVRAENNVGLGPASDPPVLVSVPNIGEGYSVLYCMHVGSASACTCVLLVHNSTDNASTIVVVHVQIVSIRHTILSVWQMLDVLMHNSANIHAQCLTMEDHL